MNNRSTLLSLISSEGEQLIEQYIDMPHNNVAIKSRNAALATAIKYLERAKAKLPSWYRARAVIDSQLFEQCSSEATAKAKFQDYSGLSALDLTCGLGVDSWALSQKFSQVTSVEIDEVKAQVARYNFKRLGANNIEVVNSSAEYYCSDIEARGAEFDLIYIDPSRISRNEKGEILKVYSLEDSSPNIIKLLPQLKRFSNQIIIKLSPLFDVEECYRIFGQDIELEIVATTTECKEVLVKVTTGKICSNQVIKHTVVTQNGANSYIVNYCSDVDLGCEQINALSVDRDFEPKYIYQPNVAFYKSRCVENYISQLIDSKEYIYSNYIFSRGVIQDGFQGQEFEISAIIPYSPKPIRRELKLRKIERATLYIKGFKYTQQQIVKELRIKEGSGVSLFFTTLRGNLVMVIANKITK